MYSLKLMLSMDYMQKNRVKMNIRDSGYPVQFFFPLPIFLLILLSFRAPSTSSEDERRQGGKG